MRFRLQSYGSSALLWLSSLILVPGVLTAQGKGGQAYSQRVAALASAPGLSDSARLHRLFDLDWEFTNIVYPENATYVGYPGQNDRWTDMSVPAIQGRRAVLPLN